MVILISLTGCLKTAEQLQKEKKFESISEQMKDSQGLVVNLVSQVKELQGQIDKLNGKIEELEHKQSQNHADPKAQSEVQTLSTQQAQLSEQLRLIQIEMKEQRSFLEKVTQSLGKLDSQPEPKTTSKKKSPKQELNEALELIKKNQYNDAKDILTNLIDHKELTPGEKNKVLFGLGKVEFYTQKFDESLVYFSKIYTRFPQASLAPGSLLFIGKSLKKLGKKDEAQQAFAKLLEDYPKAPEAKEAKKEL